MNRLFLLKTFRSMPAWLRYGITTGFVVAGLLARLALWGMVPRAPFLLFFPSVILAGVFFDRGTAIYASLLSAAVAAWFFFEPLRSLAVADPADVVAVLVFIAITVFTAYLLEALHQSLESLAEKRAKLAAANVVLQTMAEERTTLLTEAVHRSRNDLQRLAAALHLQASASDDAGARAALREASDRVVALARINARLNQNREDAHFEVDSRGFIDGLGDDLREGTMVEQGIALRVQAESHTLPMARAVPVGMIINELIGNALKYGFPAGGLGVIGIGFVQRASDFVLTVQDDGVGFDPTSPPKGSGLGVRITRALARQLGGTLDVAAATPNADRPGVCWTVRFPVACSD
jgi:two-component sensor histidine kinase